MNTVTIEQAQDAIVEEFALFEDWTAKYTYLVELGAAMPAFPKEYQTETYKIKGCQSSVWIYGNMQNGHVFFLGDSDAAIVKGLVSILVNIYSGHTPGEILDSDNGFLERIGLSEQLSPTRKNGLASMVRQIRIYAQAFQAQQDQSHD